MSTRLLCFLGLDCGMFLVAGFDCLAIDGPVAWMAIVYSEEDQMTRRRFLIMFAGICVPRPWPSGLFVDEVIVRSPLLMELSTFTGCGTIDGGSIGGALTIRPVYNVYNLPSLRRNGTDDCGGDVGY